MVTGQNINFLGDARPVTLTNSKVSVNLSYAWWQDKPAWENADWLAPSIPITMSFDEYASNQDPVLDAALTFNVQDFKPKPMDYVISLYLSGQTQKLAEELKERGLNSLYEELRVVDPEFADKIHENDRQRILRGLEVYRSTLSPISRFYNGRCGHESDSTLYIGLAMNREDLRSKIDQRVDMMINSGFVDEVRSLRESGYDLSLRSMRSIGYLELNQYLDGKIFLNDAIERIKLNTKRYAKRQMTWFRRNKKINWIDVSEFKKLNVLLDRWM